MVSIIPAPAPPFWHWDTVDRMLTALDGSNSDKDKHVRSDEDHTKLYVHDDKLHGLSSPAVKYAEGVKLIKAAINLDHGPAKGDQVFREIGIKHDKKGLKLREIGALRTRVGQLELLDAQQFRYLRLSGGERWGSIFAKLNFPDF